MVCGYIQKQEVLDRTRSTQSEKTPPNPSEKEKAVESEVSGEVQQTTNSQPIVLPVGDVTRTDHETHGQSEWGRLFIRLVKNVWTVFQGGTNVNPDNIFLVPYSSTHLHVIGAGQMRTGTTSLKRALEILYNSPCYHMSDVAYGFHGTHIQRWIELFHEFAPPDDSRTKASLLPIPQSFWNTVYQDFATAVDYPTCVFYKELMHAYPEAKIILTVRDPDEWVASCRATMLSNMMLQEPTFGDRVYQKFRGMKSLPDLHQLMFARALGQHYDRFTDEELKKSYIKWNNDVVAEVPPERLLIFDPKDGWAPLCKFLGFPQPPEHVLFPHMNKRTEMVKVLTSQHHMGRRINQCTVGLFFIIFLLISWVIFSGNVFLHGFC
ncbi:unnamed protein product [Calicophoron daubneyi]|uniref:NAD dependent epimerase/dehydratase n=1 Tax=Calicophoron daubneyi TaxID=300641 RepID=A0AAV2TA20_CALDB